jgi:hypothetical protein
MIYKMQALTYWLRRYNTNCKFAGSTLEVVNALFINLSDPSRRTCPWYLLRFSQEWLPDAENNVLRK